MATSRPWLSGGTPFKGKKIDNKGVSLYKGYMIVSSHELQFILNKRQGLSKSPKNLEKEIFPFQDIKSYGFHENVLTLRMGGSSGTSTAELVSFKLKEAIVVKELMDGVIKESRKATPRMPSFDSAFYDMNETTHKPFTPALQTNASYFDTSNYSSARNAPQLSPLSHTSTSSSVSSDDWVHFTPTYNTGGLDNPAFNFNDPAAAPIQYTRVEMTSNHPGASNARERFAKSNSVPGRFGYTTMDIETMAVLQEIDSREK